MPKLPPRQLRDWSGPLAVIAVVMIGYALAPGRLPLYGEEPCRALHGIEMAATGDWLVATNQLDPILDRPPMHYWVLAAIHKWLHALDPVTLRMSMVLTTLITSLAVWWFARFNLRRGPALIAAVAYPTMGHVFDLGRRAETDGLFAMFLAVALIVWHGGRARGWRPVVYWSAASGIAALATLTKGLQGPIAFFGSTYLFLLVTRSWRELFAPAQIIGWIAFLAPIAVWQIPFYQVAGWEGTFKTWLEPFTMRASNEGDLARLPKHLLTFPFKVFGAILPWSLLLLGLLFRPFWQGTAATRSAVVFALIVMATTMGPVWISPGGAQRYVMPMYPFVAFLAGAVIDAGLRATDARWFGSLWRYFSRGLAIGLAGFVVVLTVATIVAQFIDDDRIHTIAQPWWLLVVLAVGAAHVLRLAFRPHPADHGEAARAGRLGCALAALLAACFNGAIINAQAYNSVQTDVDVTELFARLPEGVELVSFGRVNPRFAYWYPRPIAVVPIPSTAADVPADLDYFSMDVRRDFTPALPFTYETVAVLCMDRKYKDLPNDGVLVARRTRH